MSDEKKENELLNISSISHVKILLIIAAFFLISFFSINIFTSHNNSIVAKRSVFWEKNVLPIKVYYDDTVEERRLDSIIAAIDNWNSSTGRHMFDSQLRYSNKPVANAITIGTRFYPSPSGPTERQELGYAFLIFKKIENPNGEIIRRIKRCSVYIWRELQSEYWTAVVTHELGHCLGIKHSKSKSSIMYPSISSTSAVIDEHNLNRIREIYDQRISQSN